MKSSQFSTSDLIMGENSGGLMVDQTYNIVEKGVGSTGAGKERSRETDGQRIETTIGTGISGVGSLSTFTCLASVQRE